MKIKKIREKLQSGAHVRSPIDIGVPEIVEAGEGARREERTADLGDAGALNPTLVAGEHFLGNFA